jgi:lysophospholipase L1-like esterase
MDGCFFIASPSPNNQYDPKYGWITPKSFRIYKRNKCYGDGYITYNEQGFRAPPTAEATNADVIVCILGDSTMHGYQIPDGGHLPHLLQRELEKTYRKPYVLPLAVGGYGTVQQWMLFEDFGRPMHPTVVIWHWCGNDPQNNNYTAERCFGPGNNNARPRPYFENGKIVMRNPYPVHIADRIDGLMIFKLLNGILLNYKPRPSSEMAPYLDAGWRVAEELVSRVAGEVDHKIALISSGDVKAIEMFRTNGFRVATYSLPDGCNCLPNDVHPTTKGHQIMLNALMPVLREELDR